MDKNTILDYVMNSPQNTNRAVLGSMLDSIDSGSGTETKKITLTYSGGANTEIILIDNSSIAYGQSVEVDWTVGHFIVLAPRGRYATVVPSSDKYRIHYINPNSYQIVLIEPLSNDIDEIVFTVAVDD